MSEILVSFEDKKTAVAKWIELLSGVPFDNIRGAKQTGKYTYPAVVLAKISEINTHRPFRKVEEIDGELKYVVYASKQVMVDVNFITRSRGDYTEDPSDRFLDAQHYMSKFEGSLYLPETSIEFLSANALSLLSAGSSRPADTERKDGWQRREIIEIGLGYIMQSTEPIQTIESIQGIKGSIYNFDDKFEVEINLGPYQPLSEKSQPNGYPALDGGGKVPLIQLPDLVKIKVFTAINETEQLSLTVEEGDLCVRTDENKSYAALNSDNASIADWQELLSAPLAAFISQDALNRLVSDAQIASWDAKQAALGFTPEDTTNKGIANGYASLGADGKIPDSQVPQIAITTTHTAANETEQLALIVQEGDVCVRTDESESYIALNDDNISMSDWQKLLNPGGEVTSVDGQTGTVILSAVYVALTGAQTIAGAKTFTDKFEIITGETTSSKFHFGEQADQGAWFTSSVPHQLLMSGGAEDVSDVWIARSTAASIINLANGAISFLSKTGLTPGSPFVPSLRLTIAADGKISIGNILAPDEKLHVDGNVKAIDGVFSGVVKTPTGTLTPGATVVWDMSLVQRAKLTLNQNTVLNVINLQDADYSLRLIQGGVGSFTVNWNAAFKWPNGVAPNLSQAPGSLDLMSFSCDGARIDGSFWGTDSK